MFRILRMLNEGGGPFGGGAGPPSLFAPCFARRKEDEGRSLRVAHVKKGFKNASMPRLWAFIAEKDLKHPVRALWGLHEGVFGCLKKPSL